MKKLSALVIAVLLFAFSAAALAAASRAGMLDFAGRFADGDIPSDAQDYVLTDVFSLENELVQVTLRELYYDGYLSRMTVDVRPKNAKILLLGTDMLPCDNWQNMQRLNRPWDDTDHRTAADVYEQGGYQAAYSVDVWFEEDWGAAHDGSADYHLNDDGTLTLYCQQEDSLERFKRTGSFCVSLIPYEVPLAESSRLLPEGKILLEAPLAMQKAEYPETVYVCTEPQVFASAGVRVDEVRIEVRPLEIHAAVTSTIIDPEKYAQQEDGLWFEFIDPNSTAPQPASQRLRDGLSGTGGITRSGNECVQRQTLACSELHETYTLRAYNCWTKERLESHIFRMVLEE